MPNTENRRRGAGCHPCLSVPALPNVGLAAPDRPQLAWCYPELYEQGHASDLVAVLESLSATGAVMETLAGIGLIVEALAASGAIVESLAALPSVPEALSAVPSVQESLQANVGVQPG